MYSQEYLARCGALGTSGAVTVARLFDCHAASEIIVNGTYRVQCCTSMVR